MTALGGAGAAGHGGRIAGDVADPATALPGPDAHDPLFDDLEAGRIRAAEPDASVPGGWRVRPEVKAAILDRFGRRGVATWAAGPLTFRDRAAVPPRDVRDGPWRVVPGGSAVRRGAHLGADVVVMPPSYINVGAWVGEATMVDSHVLVGSCAQIGARVHLAAGVLIGGVLEPPGARPVIVEDDAFVGAGSSLLDGVLVGREAVIGAGVMLTGTSRLYDLVRERVIIGTAAAPLAVPPGAVVAPGARPAKGTFAADHGLSLAVALLVKDRDPGTSARVALETALR
jgi:2,3,4,5-tetrahydropyridine-2-carboxylate N-succinyltransferase